MFVPYQFNTPRQQEQMLKTIGVKSLDELFRRQVPAELHLGRLLELPPPLVEMELEAHVAALAHRNAQMDRHVCMMGGGAYDHFIPAAVDAVATRGEFYTAYTPYQPEASQ